MATLSNFGVLRVYNILDQSQIASTGFDFQTTE